MQCRSPNTTYHRGADAAGADWRTGAKLAALLVNRFVRHNDVPFQEELFAIAETETEAKGQPHGVTDNFHGEAVMLISLANK